MKREKYVAYAGTYTNGTSKGIHIYNVDVNNGRLEERKEVPINNASDLIVSHNGRVLYSIADEGVVSFKILPDGDLEFLNMQAIGGMRGCHLALDRKDRFLFVAGYHDGKVTMMHLKKDGKIGGIADGIFHKSMGVSITDRSMQPHVTCVRLTPDQKYLCAVDGGLNHAKVYEIDYERGKLKLSNILRCQLDAGAKYLIFSRNGEYAYLLCERKCLINVYSYHNGAGDFELIQTISTVDKDDPEGCVASTIKMSEDGNYLLCANAGTDTVAIFHADAVTGMLDLMCQSKISGDYPKALAMMPDGMHFLSLNHETNEIVTFKIDFEHKYFLLHGKPVAIEKPNSIWIHRLQ